MSGRLFVGTSGWVYKSWKDSWYGGIPTKDWLAFSAAQFTALEVDGTFYRLQSRETFESWARATPESFRFAIRGSRFTTHNKKLIDAPASIAKQREPALGMGPKLAAVIWQLPPRWRVNLERLETFGEALATGWPETRHAIEFRNETWFTEEVLDVLRRHKLANCISDAANFPRWDAVTTDMVYVRLHGKPDTYASNYDDSALNEWAKKARAWLDEGRDVHVYFDNDILGHAPRNAVDLVQRIGRANGERVP
jgi:uncharacterized protein YecE (DUF72 family)